MEQQTDTPKPAKERTLDEKIAYLRQWASGIQVHIRQTGASADTYILLATQTLRRVEERHADEISHSTALRAAVFALRQDFADVFRE